MATFFGSPPSLARPITRTLHFSASPQVPPPLPSQQPGPASQPQTSSAASPEQQPDPVVPLKAQTQRPVKPATKVESTDWVATSLTRRFGLGAGLAWAGFLAFGVVSEQIKTRLEVSQQEANTRNVEEEKEVVLPNGIRYYDLRVGGGASPIPGDLVVIDLKGTVEGTAEVFVDTFQAERPLALVMESRPYTRGVCEGIELVLRSMKAGGKRRVVVPPSLGFGEKGADLGNGVQIPPFATLEYVVQVDKVSIAPA